MPIAQNLYESFSEEHYDDEGYVKGVNKESFLHSLIVPFHSQPAGPPQLGLLSIKHANKLFDKPIFYQSNRSKKKTDSRYALETTEVRGHLKTITFTMKNHNFDGNNPIKILDFLIRLVNEADILKMSEGQAFVALPKFLDDTADQNFRTNLSGTPRWACVTVWLETVQYLLRTYENNYFCYARNEEYELEEYLRKRFNNDIHRCGNVHAEDENITLYIDGLSATTRAIVARHRERVSRREITFEDILHFWPIRRRSLLRTSSKIRANT